MNTVPLTSLAHGGGCGCKLAPSVLQSMLKNQPDYGPFKHLLVGTETSDDAAVYELDNGTCIIATTDFFMPMVDDPATFGRIAATNAISDIYAMGGKPIMALAILGMPIDKLAPEVVAEILRGGREKAAEAGIAVAGGHSIDCPEPVYGLAVIGTCDKQNLRRNMDAQTGDCLLLLKGLGVGHYSAAFKKGKLDTQAYDEMIASMTQLNTIGAELGGESDIHAITDVTGFGILGHSLEMAKGANKTLQIHFDRLPFLSQAEELAAAGFVTGASKRNWESYKEFIKLDESRPLHHRHMLTDPQTSGGLLLSVAPQTVERTLALAQKCGYHRAAKIGNVIDGPPQISII